MALWMCTAVPKGGQAGLCGTVDVYSSAKRRSGGALWHCGCVQQCQIGSLRMNETSAVSSFCCVERNRLQTQLWSQVCFYTPSWLGRVSRGSAASRSTPDRCTGNTHVAKRGPLLRSSTWQGARCCAGAVTQAATISSWGLATAIRRGHALPARAHLHDHWHQCDALLECSLLVCQRPPTATDRKNTMSGENYISTNYVGINSVPIRKTACFFFFMFRR